MSQTDWLIAFIQTEDAGEQPWPTCISKADCYCSIYTISGFQPSGRRNSAIDAAGADWIHVDVMDGRFVPIYMIGPLIVEGFAQQKKPIDVHLMIGARKVCRGLCKAGADHITVHAEITPRLTCTASGQIKELGKKAGVVLNPSTPLDLLEYVLELCDLVLIMSQPRFWWSELYPHCSPQSASCARWERSWPWIEVDGGLKENNTWQVIEAGANAIVAGSAVLSEGLREGNWRHSS